MYPSVPALELPVVAKNQVHVQLQILKAIQGLTAGMQTISSMMQDMRQEPPTHTSPSSQSHLYDLDQLILDDTTASGYPTAQDTSPNVIPTVCIGFQSWTSSE